MKVLGMYVDTERGSYRVPQGSYIVIDAQVVDVDTYNGKPTTECEECFLRIHSGYFCANIKTKDGRYFSPEIAKKIVKELATKDVIDLDEYDMALFYVSDTTPDTIGVSNDIDEDCNSIPLEVVIVNN